MVYLKCVVFPEETLFSNSHMSHVTARSPVYSHISSTLNGLTTIRAFRVESDFNAKFCDTQDMHTATWFLNIGMTRWIGLWLDVIAVVFIASVTMTLMLTASTSKCYTMKLRTHFRVCDIQCTRLCN